MTTHVFFTLILILLVSSALKKPSGRNRRSAATIVTMVILAAFAILPIVSRRNWLVVTLFMVVIVITNMLVAALISNRYKARTIAFSINATLTIAVIGRTAWFPTFNQPMLDLIATLGGTNVITSIMDPEAVNALIPTVCGLFIATVEMNNPIAWILKHTNLMPSDDAPGSEPRRLNTDAPARGRVIGYLERGLVFLLTITGNLSAIGLVLVAKGIARYQQMDNRDFAEYVLIGTLLSISAAILSGFVFVQFM